KTLRQLGRLKEAQDYAERAYDKAERVQHEVAINQSLLERARIYTAQHDLSRASAMLDKVEPRLRKSLPPGHYGFAVLASLRSQVAAAGGNRSSALSLADEAVSILETTIRSGNEGSYYLPVLLISRSNIEREAHRTEAAIGDASR